MELNIAGRVAFVTGASKGIGRTVAEGLAAEGCHLHLSSRSEAGLKAVEETLRARHNVSVTIHPADISDASAREAVAEAVGDIDILINNAGAIPGGDLEMVDDAAWRQAWELKVFGYIDFARRFYPMMKARGRGVIVCISGAAGRCPTTSPAAPATRR